MNKKTKKTKKTKKQKRVRKLRIVLIDDEKDILDIYKAKFRTKNFRVFCAKNGRDGVALVLKHNPDIVLSDVVMPGGDGFYVLKKLRKNEETKKMPIIVFTQLDSGDDKKESLERGATDYLVKVKNTPAQAVKKVMDVLKKSKR